MPHLETCLGCCRLEIGGYIIGCLGIFVVLIIFVPYILLKLISVVDNFEGIPYDKNFHVIVDFVVVVLFIFLLLTFILVIVGVKMRKHKLLVPNLIIYVISMLDDMKTFLSFDKENYPLAAVDCFFAIYFFYVIYSLYKKFQDENNIEKITQVQQPMIETIQRSYLSTQPRNLDTQAGFASTSTYYPNIQSFSAVPQNLNSNAIGNSQLLYQNEKSQEISNNSGKFKSYPVIDESSSIRVKSSCSEEKSNFTADESSRIGMNSNCTLERSSCVEENSSCSADKSNCSAEKQSHGIENKIERIAAKSSCTDDKFDRNEAGDEFTCNVNESSCTISQSTCTITDSSCNQAKSTFTANESNLTANESNFTADKSSSTVTDPSCIAEGSTCTVADSICTAEDPTFMDGD